METELLRTFLVSASSAYVFARHTLVFLSMQRDTLLKRVKELETGHTHNRRGSTKTVLVRFHLHLPSWTGLAGMVGKL